MSRTRVRDRTAVAIEGVAAPAASVPPPTREAAVAVVGLFVLVSVGYGFSLGFEVSNLHNGLQGLAYSAVGLYVLRMRPRHPVGMLFLASGLQSALMFFGRQYGLHQPALPAAPWFAWMSIWQVPLAMAVTGFTIMVFPTGRLLSPRWRLPAGAMVAVCVFLATVSALWPIEDDWRRGELTFPFATPGAATALSVFEPVMLVSYQAFLILWVVAVAVRVRRARGDETRQLRWFVFAVALAAAVLIGGLAVFGSPVPGLVATSLIPVAAGVAILKYRLYDIDPILTKTVVVAILAALVTVGYVAVVVVIGALVPASHIVLSLLATAAVAVAFEPVRQRAQQVADRLVYGPRTTPYDALARLSTQLDAPPDEVLIGVCATVAHAVRAKTVRLWVGSEDGLHLATAYPGPAPVRRAATLEELTKQDGTAVLRPITHRRVTVGALDIRLFPGDRLGAGEERLLTDLVAQAGLVIEHRSRLLQVADQAAELRAATRRVVTAQDDARRRLERDLHDGVQHRLVTLALVLGGLADRASATGDHDLAARAHAAREQLLEATAELRELARGIHPAVLTHDGLPAALANLTDRAHLPVRLTVSVDRRLPPEVEATAYFLVAEALTNAARHSAAEQVWVTVEDRNDALSVEVVDDGAGGASTDTGTGLQGLADRLAALGAQLTIESRTGAGTTVRTEIQVR